MRLCRRCGLCCDGTIFTSVPLTESEAARLKLLGMPTVVREGRPEALLQPCAALIGKDCRHYEARPTPCRTFRCHQLIALSEGEASEQDAMAQVESVWRRVAVLAEHLGIASESPGVMVEARRQHAAGVLSPAAQASLEAVESLLSAHITRRAPR